MRKINTKFFVVLVITVALVSGALFGVHRLQAGNIAEALLWHANQAEKDGKLDRAAKYLGRYLEFARDDLDQREHLALIVSDPQLATTPHRRARARFVIEQVLAKDPQRHALRHRLVQILITGRMFDAAKEHLNLLEKDQPNSAESAFLLGSWHEAQNQSPSALEAYRRAIKLDASNVDACIRLVAILEKADFGKEPRHRQEIEKLVTTALEKSPQDPAVLSLAARHAQQRGDARTALSYLQDGLKQSPNEPRLYLALAQLHGQAGKGALAIDQLKLGLTKVRKDQQYDLRWSLANLLLDENRLDDVQVVIAELRDANPLSADYLEARRDMLRGRWFEAAKQLEKIRPALKGVKELAFQADLYLGACYEQLEEPALQLTSFQRAAEADGTSLAARRGMASAFWALGQQGEALAISQQLVAGTKDQTEAAQRRIEHVRMLLQNGQPQNSRDWAKIEQELAAIEKTLAKSLDVPLLRAELLFVKAEREQAENLLHEAIKNHPQRHEPWMMLVAFAASKNEAKVVAQLLQSAEERFKDKSAFRLAQIRFWGSRQDAEAAAALEKIEAELANFLPREQSALLQALAESHFDAHRYPNSERALNRLLQLPMHAQDMRARMQILELALVQTDDSKARAALVQIKKIEGDAGVDGSFGEALRIIRVERPTSRETQERARHLLTVAAAQRPNWHPIVQARAELDELQGRPDQAIANYRRAIDLGSRDPRAAKQLLVLLSQAQRFDEVEEVLSRMQKHQGTTEELVRYYVAHSYNRNDLRKAEFLIKQVVAGNSTNFRDHLWMGQILSASGQSPAEAEKALRCAVALAPEHAEAWINLVRHLISVGQFASAKAEMDKAGQALPRDKKDLALGQCCELFGLLADAAKHYESALGASRSPAQAYRAAGDFHLRVNSFLHAEFLYRQVFERKVDVSEEDVSAARRGLALALVKQNRPHQAAEALRLVNLTLDDKGLLPEGKIADGLDEQLLQAKVLGSLNHHRLRAKAIIVLEALLQKNALAADDQFFLARLYAQADKDAATWAKARNLLKSLIQQFPKNARYLAYAAHAHLQQKDFTEGESIIARLEIVERERKAPPGGFGSIELRAKMLELRGFDSQAVTLLTSYAEQSEAAPVRKLLVAHMQGRLGNYRDAIDLCEAVRKSAPLFHDANAAAVAILRVNKPSEALFTKHAQWQEQRRRVESFLRDAVAKDAKNTSSRLHLADLMELQGNHGDVEKLCREVLKEAPTNLVALNNLAWLLGQKADTAAEALPLIERALEKYGPRPELVDTRAVAQLHLGNYEAALRDLERVVNEAPTPARLFHLSVAFEKSKNIPSAVATLRRANDLGLTMQQLHPAEHAEYQRVTAALGKRP